MAIRYIFCINTGRAGSKYLYHLFADHPQVASFHEPAPIMHKQPMRAWLQGQPQAMRSLTPAKWQAIQQAKGTKSVYLEANHCFIKGFGWELMQYLPQDEVLVLVLKRERAPVVNSLLRIRCHPLNSFGADWLICPARQGIANVGPLSYLLFRLLRWFDYYYIRLSYKYFARRLPDLLIGYKRYWLGRYYDWTYALGAQFQQQYPCVHYREVQLHQLNDADWLRNFCTELNLPYTHDMARKIGQKVNEGRAGVPVEQGPTNHPLSP
jgi:hypothetical protein